VYEKVVYGMRDIDAEFNAFIQCTIYFCSITVKAKYSAQEESQWFCAPFPLFLLCASIDSSGEDIEHRRGPGCNPVQWKWDDNCKDLTGQVKSQG
jgi:hypothetical protein